MTRTFTTQTSEQQMDNRCPECGSTRVSADGDMIEELCGPDCEPMPTYFYSWWLCEDCGHQFRYQDEKLNPHLAAPGCRGER